MKPYTLEFAGKALKELERLPKKVVERIHAAIQALAANPRPQGSIKLEGSEDLYRIRVGKYRVVYSVDDESIVVLIIRIRHRKDAYQ